MPLLRRISLAFACALISAVPAFAAWLPGGTQVQPDFGFGRYLYGLQPDPNGGATLLYYDDSYQPTKYSPIRYVRIDREGVTHTTNAPYGQENKILGGSFEYGPLTVGPSTTLGPGGAFFSDYFSRYGQFIGVVVRPDGSVASSGISPYQGPMHEVVYDGLSGFLDTSRDGTVHASHRGSDLALDWTNDAVSAPGTAGSHTPRICPDGAGGAFVAWEDTSASPRRAFLQHLGPGGQPAPGWPAGGTPVATGSHLGEIFPDVVPDGAGGVYIGWLRAQPSSATSTGITFRYKLTHRTAAGAIHPAWPDSGLRISSFGLPVSTFAADPNAPNRLRMLFDGVDGVYFLGSGGSVTHVGADGTIPPGWGAGLGKSFSSFAVPNYLPLPIAVDGSGGLYVLGMDFPAGENNQRPMLHHLTRDGTYAAGWNGPIALGVPTDQSVAGLNIYSDLVVTTEGWPLVAWCDGRTGDSRTYVSLVQLDAPVAAEASLVTAESGPGVVRLCWQLSGGAGIEPALERRESDGAWASITNLLPDGNGRVQFEDRGVTPGASYDYRLVVTEAGVTRQLSTARVSVPSALFALAPRCALPSRGDLAFAVTLPASGDARLELIDVTGRRVADRRLIGAAAGTHAVRLGEGSLLPPGVYTARLSFAGQLRISRVVIAR